MQVLSAQSGTTTSNVAGVLTYSTSQQLIQKRSQIFLLPFPILKRRNNNELV